MSKTLAVFLIAVYQRYLKIIFPAACRFSPSCSDYAQQAIMRYGFFKGAWCATRRLLSCHPFSRKSGYDPLI